MDKNGGLKNKIREAIDKFMPDSSPQIKTRAQRSWFNWMHRHGQTGVRQEKNRAGEVTSEVPVYRQMFPHKMNRTYIHNRREVKVKPGKQFPEYTRWKERFDAKNAK